MKRIKLNLPLALLLTSVLSIACLTAMAQSLSNETQGAWAQQGVENNFNLMRLFRLINSLNKQADKQEAKGFPKRAESIRRYFQKKTGITDETKLKLNEIAANFMKEYENISSAATEFRKNQKDSPNDKVFASELGKLRESRNKLYDSTRKSLSEALGNNNLEPMSKFIREVMVRKNENPNLPKPNKLLKDKANSGVFQKISYNKTALITEAYGYSFVDFDSLTGDGWGYSVTEPSCEAFDELQEYNYGCIDGTITAQLLDPSFGMMDYQQDSQTSGWAEAYLSGTATYDGLYCVSAEHTVTDYYYGSGYTTSSDCTDLELVPNINKIQYQDPVTGNFTNADSILYVLKGTQVRFKAATQDNQPVLGTWSGTGGASGTDQTAYVTFNNTSSSSNDHKTIIVSNEVSQQTVYVVVYEFTGILTPQDNFSGRSLDTYGVSEKVELNFTSNPTLTTQQIGGLTWTVTTGLGTIPITETGAATYTAPDIASNEALKLQVISGPSKGNGHSYNKAVVAPSSAVAVQNTTYGNIVHRQGLCSVGFYLTPYLRPTNVSFREILFFEDIVAPTVATGYYASDPAWHTLGSTYSVLGGNISLGNQVDFIDTVLTEGTPPCASGEFIWDIPWKYVGSLTSASHQFHTARHRQYIPAYNVVSIEKAGVGPFTKAVSDPDSF